MIHLDMWGILGIAALFLQFVVRITLSVFFAARSAFGRSGD